MDLYFIAQNEEDNSFFPPASFFGFNSFTPSGGKFTHIKTDRHICLWNVSTEDNLGEIAAWTLQIPNVKDIYIGQAFDSSTAHGRYLNCQLLREVLQRRREEGTFLIIRDSKDKELLNSLSDLQENINRKLKIRSISENLKLSLVILPKRPQPAAVLLLSRSSSEANPIPEEVKAPARPNMSRQHSDIPSPLLDIVLSEEAKTLPVQRAHASVPRLDPQAVRAASIPRADIPFSQPRPNPQQAAAPAVDIASLNTVPHSSEVHPPQSSPPEAELKFQEEDLRCIVCLGIYQGSLSSDCCGAVICRSCAPNLRNRCPQCRRNSHFLENKALNRILSGLKEYCSCKQEVTARTKEEHMKVCPNRSFHCPKCKDQMYKKEEFKQHLKNYHMPEILVRMDRYQLI